MNPKKHAIAKAGKFSGHQKAQESHVTTEFEKDNVHFLQFKNQVPKKEEAVKLIHLENDAHHVADIEKLTRTELSKKYSKTYSSWKNMKSRCKTGKVLDPKFADFKDFLKIMGPCPDKNFTLDRVDNENPNYSPDNCRWADKTTQNQNKGNNVYLTYKDETLTVSAWAAKTGQKPATLYRRKSLDWSDVEVIEGKKQGSEQGQTYWSYTPWPEGQRLVWEIAYQKHAFNEEHRLRFYLRYTDKQLDWLYEMAELFNPEIAVPEDWTRKDEYWRAIAQDAKAKLAAGARNKRGMYLRSLPNSIERSLSQAVLREQQGKAPRRQ